MKKFPLLMLAVIACVTARADDGNTLYFTDAIVKPGETTYIELCMRNSVANLTCLEAEIQLPEGLSVASDGNGNPRVVLYRNRIAGHECLANVLDNGNIRLLVCSIEAETIGEGDGPILSFCVEASQIAISGDCTVTTVGETLLVDTEARAYYSVGTTGIVTITDDETDLRDVEGRDDAGGTTYNLAGQAVNGKTANGRPARGIFIRNGRKELHR